MKRGLEAVAGFAISASLGLWLPLAAFGLQFAHSESPNEPLLWSAIPANIWPLLPIGLWLLVVGLSLWLGIKRRQQPFSLGLLVGVIFAVAGLTMFFVANRLVA